MPNVFFTCFLKKLEYMDTFRTNFSAIQSILRATSAILEFESFELSARKIFDEARLLTQAQSGYIALLNEEGDENEVLFLEAGGEECSVDPSLPMPIRGLRAESYRSGKTVFHNDFMNSQFKPFMPEGHVPLNNVLFAPLIIEKKVVGIMGLANKPANFTDEDASIASVFGEFAAIALKNSHTLDKLRQTVSKLEHTLKEVKTLEGLLPICSHCKNIRDDQGYWHQVEEYMRHHSKFSFTHSLCPKCAKTLYPELNTDLE